MKEFFELKLGSMPIDEYERMFLEMLKYVSFMLAQGHTQGSMLHQCTNKTLTTDPFGNTCKMDEVSSEVEVGGLQDSDVCNLAGTQSYDYNTLTYHLVVNIH
jgi:hypothetical protein